MPSRLRRHDEFGHIHFVTISTFRRLPFFRNDECKTALIEAMVKTRARLHIRWIGYVIMPEHMHLLVLPQPSQKGGATEIKTVPEKLIPISTVLRHFKGASGRGVKQVLRSAWRTNQTLGTRSLDEWATRDGEKPIWKPRGYDFNVVDERKLPEKLQYMHENPVRRGIVRQPGEWCWSSFGHYEKCGTTPLIELDWDGSFPLPM